MDLQKLISLSEVGTWCEGGQYHPLLLEVLQSLRELVGLERLQDMLEDSKVGMMLNILVQNLRNLIETL